MPQEELMNDPVRSFKLLTCQFVNGGDGRCCVYMHRTVAHHCPGLWIVPRLLKNYVYENPQKKESVSNERSFRELLTFFLNWGFLKDKSQSTARSGKELYVSKGSRQFLLFKSFPRFQLNLYVIVSVVTPRSYPLWNTNEIQECLLGNFEGLTFIN